MVMILGLVFSVMPVGMVGFADANIVVSSYSVSKSEINYNDTFTLKVNFNKPGTANSVTANISGSNFLPMNGKVQYNEGELTSGVSVKYAGGSKTISLVINYNDGAAKTTTESFTISEVNEVSTSGSSSSTPTDTSKYKPRLQVKTDGKIPTLTAGLDSEFKLNIENIGKYSAKKLTLTLEQSGDDFPFENKNVTNSVNVESIKTKSTEEVTFPVEVKVNAKPITYPVKLKYTYENNLSFLHRVQD